MNLNNNRPIMILGNVNTGKTNLMVYLGNSSGYADKYTLGIPVALNGYQSLSSIQEVNQLRDCVLLIDEIDEVIPIMEKRSNEQLKQLLRFTAHRNIKIIMNTQLSQFVNKMMEALIPCWAITELDIFSLKNGSKPKRILLDFLKRPEIVNKVTGMNLDIGRFVWYNEKGRIGETGIYPHPQLQQGKIGGWNEQVKQNPDENCDKNQTKTATENSQKVRQKFSQALVVKQPKREEYAK